MHSSYSVEDFMMSSSVESPHRTAIFISGKSSNPNHTNLLTQHARHMITPVDAYERSEFESLIKFKKFDDGNTDNNNNNINDSNTNRSCEEINNNNYDTNNYNYNNFDSNKKTPSFKMTSLRDSLPKLNVKTPESIHDEKMSAFSVYKKEIINKFFNYNCFHHNSHNNNNNNNNSNNNNHNNCNSSSDNNLSYIERGASLESLSNKLNLSNEDDANLCSLNSSSMTTRSSLESLPRIYDPAIHRHPLLHEKFQQQQLQLQHEQDQQQQNGNSQQSRQNDVSQQQLQQQQHNPQQKIPTPPNQNPNPPPSQQQLKTRNKITNLTNNQLPIIRKRNECYQNLKSHRNHCPMNSRTMVKLVFPSPSKNFNEEMFTFTAFTSNKVKEVIRNHYSSMSSLHQSSLSLKKNHKRTIKSLENEGKLNSNNNLNDIVSRLSIEPCEQKRICLSNFTNKSDPAMKRDRKSRQFNLFRTHRRSSSYNVTARMCNSEVGNKLFARKHSDANTNTSIAAATVATSFTTNSKDDNNNNIFGGKNIFKPCQQTVTRSIITRSKTRQIDEHGIPSPILANLEDGLSITDLDKLTIENTIINGGRRNINPTTGNTPIATSRYHKIKWKEEVVTFTSPTNPNSKKNLPKITKIQPSK
ncbi:hypothetical protein HELRODRAFT_177265 [Helobdella robusta]|uniref:Uncharacterized protein n=1 Tax=Helobdella robusta TaxID=6412 RepID=T1FBF4_HELRO|nr:hypothetical protein HELRODRAFT_177265 [Helobdella robusta]ESN98036.1 hypothetical protein HELRODRAFT_177265 [Helobdella robusta]